MKRVFLLLGTCLVMSLLFAPAALAQDDSSVQDPANCPAGTRAVGDNSGFTGCVPVEELCDADALTPSQYAECTATQEEITSGGSGAGQGTPTVASAQGGTLPDTGGLELPILVGLFGGLALVLGGLVLRKRMS